MYDSWKVTKHCRWCGKAYQAHQPHGRDGFCGKPHKQAHYRAYKAYVIAKKDHSRS